MLLNGTATPVTLKRLPKGAGARVYVLPASVGAFFQSCWDGSTTRAHALENGTCPNCGGTHQSARFQSLHAIKTDSSERPKVVIALDHRLTQGLAIALKSPEYVVRPLEVRISSTGDVTASILSLDNVSIADVSEAAIRIVTIWQRYFRHRITDKLDQLNSGESWLK